MLAFSLIFDSHFHINKENFDKIPINFNGCICCGSEAEWKSAEKFSCYKTFGIHPWTPVMEKIDFLLSLLESDKIDGIGESGLDFFTPDLRSSFILQKECWNAQLELAAEFNKPLVVHCRKAFPEILKDSEKLACLKSVCFHGFSGSKEQAFEILRKIPDAYFSFGAVLLKKNRKASECLLSIPCDHILFETDAAGTDVLPAVYDAAWSLIKERRIFESQEEFAENILKNQKKFFR